MPVIVCFSYGLEKDGSFGKVNEARCEKAARLYERLTKRHKGRTWIVVTAGMIPNFSQQKEPLGIMQREYLEGQCGVPRLRIFPRELELFLWREQGKNIMSTAQEIDAAISVAAEKGISGPFYAVSHWFHLPRILWLGWWHGVHFRPAPVFRPTPWKSVAAELPKWFVAFIDPTDSKGVGRRATKWARQRHIW